MEEVGKLIENKNKGRSDAETCDLEATESCKALTREHQKVMYALRKKYGKLKKQVGRQSACTGQEMFRLRRAGIGRSLMRGEKRVHNRIEIERGYPTSLEEGDQSVCRQVGEGVASKGATRRG